MSHVLLTHTKVWQGLDLPGLYCKTAVVLHGISGLCYIRLSCKLFTSSFLCNSTVSGGFPLPCVVFCGRFEPLPSELHFMGSNPT